MRRLPPFSNPYIALRHTLAGTGYRFAYFGNGNDGDALRGEFFTHTKDHFARTVFINKIPPDRAGYACFLLVARNPTPQFSDWLVQQYPKDCGCRLIVDASAPFWGGFDIQWIGGAVTAEQEASLVSAVQAAAAVSDLVTVPWAEYAEGLRRHEDINAAHVPDFDPGSAKSHDEHAISWGAAIAAARNRG